MGLLQDTEAGREVAVAYSIRGTYPDGPCEMMVYPGDLLFQAEYGCFQLFRIGQEFLSGGGAATKELVRLRARKYRKSFQFTMVCWWVR